MTGKPEVRNAAQFSHLRIVALGGADTRCRPPCGLGIGAGRSGRIKLHSASGTSAAAMRDARIVQGEVLLQALKIQAPEIRRRLLEFQAEFPARAAFVAAPHQNGFARNLVDEIDQPQLLSHAK